MLSKAPTLEPCDFVLRVGWIGHVAQKAEDSSGLKDFRPGRRVD